MEKIKNIIEKAKKLDKKTLEFYKGSIIFGIVVDLLFVYYYLSLESLASAILIVLILGLTITLLLERRLEDKGTPKERLEDLRKEIKVEEKKAKVEDLRKEIDKLEGKKEFNLQNSLNDIVDKALPTKEELGLGKIDLV